MISIFNELYLFFLKKAPNLLSFISVELLLGSPIANGEFILFLYTFYIDISGNLKFKSNSLLLVGTLLSWLLIPFIF